MFPWKENFELFVALWWFLPNFEIIGMIGNTFIKSKNQKFARQKRTSSSLQVQCAVQANVNNPFYLINRK
jgi:hypothetical protein